MSDLLARVLLFLQERITPSSKLLLGFSGGGDSLCLLSLLLECQKTLNFQLELAHLDHNCREKSGQEAAELKEYAKSKGLVMHLKRLKEIPSNNIEDFFRVKRSQFFYTLFQKHGYQALLLAHHQNDEEETILKRVLEGGRIESLSSLDPISYYQNMPLWRPLIGSLKKELNDWNYTHQLNPIEDPTNFDGSNLRSKMRVSILPTLEAMFGKKVGSSLKRISSFSKRYQSYMEDKTSLFEGAKESFFGCVLDFTRNHWHPLEIEFLVSKELKKRGVYLHHAELAKLSNWVHEGASNKKMIKGDHLFIADRCQVFILPYSFIPLPRTPLKLEPGKYSFGPWEVNVTKAKYVEEARLGWGNLFEKEAHFFIQVPQGEFYLGEKGQGWKWGSKHKLSNLLTKHKILSELSQRVPMVGRGGDIEVELLTGKVKTNHSIKPQLNICLSYKKD